MNDIKEIFNTHSETPVAEILGKPGIAAKKKVTYTRFHNQPVLSTTMFWRGNFFQPLTVNQNEVQAAGKSCFFCDSLSSTNKYDYLELDESNTAKNIICVCVLCQLPRYLGSTLLENKGTATFLRELSQTEVNSICRYILLSEYVYRLGHKKIKELNLQSEFSDWLLNSYNELQGLYAALNLNSTTIFKPLNEKNATFNVHLAELLSHMLKNKPEMYAQREKIFKGILILPTKYAYTEQEMRVLLKEGNYSKKNMDGIFEKMEEWTK